MHARIVRSVLAIALLCGSASVVGCSKPRDPIVISEGMVVVENQTSTDWKNVRVTVNHHYVGGAPLLAAGGRLNAPLSQFRTGFGHPFDRTRMSEFKVDVTATGADGQRVTLNWGKP